MAVVIDSDWEADSVEAGSQGVTPWTCGAACDERCSGNPVGLGHWRNAVVAGVVGMVRLGSI